MPDQNFVLQRELGVNIFTRNLVWIEGPYPAGAWPDLKIFNNVLAHCLEPGECVEADYGYVGRPNKVKCPHNNCNPAENLGMLGVARSCYETFNGLLKNWGILEKTCCHDIMAHGTVFYACVVIMQLSIANRELLLEVKYSNNSHSYIF